jgi:6-phosphogluconolactonase (cycloisomerase 2 family)
MTMTRRTFSTLLAGSVAVPSLSSGISWGQMTKHKTALYSGVGPEFTHYEVDVDAATLTKRGSVKLPGGVQYVWPHHSRQFLYVTSSTGGPGMAGNSHHASAFRMDASGALQPHGEPIALEHRPIHHSLDRSGEYLLTAYNNPSGATVHRIKSDGAIGELVLQPDKLDYGIYGHQILAAPGNQSVILVARGNNAAGAKPEDPGSLKVFSFKNGVLTNKASVQPGTGLGFGPRHLDFHPSEPWVYVSVERQNQIYAYKLAPDGGLSPEPLFIKDTVRDPSKHVSSAGPIHVHPSGRFVYLTNRHGWTSSPPPGHETYEGKRVFTSNESNIAVFAIDQKTGEPKLIDLIDSRGAHVRTFSFDASGRILVAGSLVPIALREGGRISVLPAGLSVFRVSQDGQLDFVRKYDIETGNLAHWWSGMVTLA